MERAAGRPALGADPAAGLGDRPAAPAAVARAGAAHGEQPRRGTASPAPVVVGVAALAGVGGSRRLRCRLRGTSRRARLERRRGRRAGASARATVRVVLGSVVAPGRPSGGSGGVVVAEDLVEQVLVEPGRVERVAPAPVRERQPGGRADVLAGDRRSRPRQAACATAVRAVTMSARMPSTSKAAHTSAILSSAGVGQLDLRRPAPGRPAIRVGQRALGVGVRARRTRPGRRRRPSGGVPPRRAAPGPAARRPRRSARTGRAAAAAARPPRGSSCRPARTGRRARPRRRPARRSTRPIAAASSSRSTRWSWSRLTSSTYRIPRCARASSPGSYSALPSRQRALEVQRAEHPVLGGADRAARPAAPAGSRSRRRPRTGRRGQRRPGRRGSLENRSPATTVDRRQHRGQRAHDRRLRGALLAADQDAADLGGDRGEDQGQRHVVGTPDRRRLKGNAVGMEAPARSAMDIGDARREAGLRTSRSRLRGGPGHRSGPVPDSHRLPRFSPPRPTS